MTSKNSKDTKCSTRLGWAFLIALISVLGISMLITSLLPSPTSSNLAFAKREDPKTPFVEDNARVLTAKTRKRVADLNRRAANEPGSPQLLVVTVNSLDRFSINKLANQKGKQYGIGSKDTHPGLVYIVSAEDNESYLATGDSIDSKITQPMATHMLESKTVAASFKEGDYDKGVNSVLSTIQPYFLGERKASDYPKNEIVMSRLSAALVNVALVIAIICVPVATVLLLDKYLFRADPLDIDAY